MLIFNKGDYIFFFPFKKTTYCYNSFDVVLVQVAVQATKYKYRRLLTVLWAFVLCFAPHQRLQLVFAKVEERRKRASVR